jgi:lipopolysaccharide export system protein LptA
MRSVRGAIAIGLAGALVVFAAGAQPNSGAMAAVAPSNPADLSAVSAPRGEEPVDISSDEAHVSEGDRTVIMSGHVIARQGEMQLQADTVTVHYLAGAVEKGAPKGKIDSLEASGNVVVTRPGEIVKSVTATYKMIEKQILMKGNVIATRGTTVVRGDSLIVDLVKETVRLQSDAKNGRVHAIFSAPPNGGKP